MRRNAHATTDAPVVPQLRKTLIVIWTRPNDDPSDLIRLVHDQANASSTPRVAYGISVGVIEDPENDEHNADFQPFEEE